MKFTQIKSKFETIFECRTLCPFCFQSNQQKTKKKRRKKRKKNQRLFLIPVFLLATLHIASKKLKFVLQNNH